MDSVNRLLQTIRSGSTRHASRSSHCRVSCAMCSQNTSGTRAAFATGPKIDVRPRLMTYDDVVLTMLQQRRERLSRSPDAVGAPEASLTEHRDGHAFGSQLGGNLPFKRQSDGHLHGGRQVPAARERAQRTSRRHRRDCRYEREEPSAS